MSLQEEIEGNEVDYLFDNQNPLISRGFDHKKKEWKEVTLSSQEVEEMAHVLSMGAFKIMSMKRDLKDKNEKISRMEHRIKLLEDELAELKY